MTNQKGNTNIILLAVIVALVGALVYLVGVPRGEENGSIVTSLAPTPATQDQIAGWQTYRNEKYGFEVKYPGDWFVENCADETVVYFDYQEIYCGTEGHPSISIDITTLSSEKLIELVGGSWTFEDYKREQVEISGLQATQVGGIIKEDSEGPGPGAGTKYLSHIFSHNGNTYDITFVEGRTENLSSIFTSILSTFKFIE